MATLRGVHEWKVGIGLEGTYGVVGTHSRLIPCEFSTDLFHRDGVIKPQVNGARTDVQMYKREGMIGGNISLSADVSSVGEVFAGFFGTRSSVGAGGTGIHTFTPAGTISDAMTSLCMLIDYGQTTVFNYSGIRVNTLNVSCNAKEDVKVSADIVGKLQSTGTKNADLVYGTFNPLTFDQITFTVDGTSVNPRNFSIELNNSLSEGFRVGTEYTPVRPLPSEKMTGVISFDLDFESVEEFNKYIGNNSFAVDINMTQGAILVGTTQAVMRFTFPKVYYQAASFETFDGLLGVTFSGQIMDGTNSTGTGNIICKLQNNVIAY